MTQPRRVTLDFDGVLNTQRTQAEDDDPAAPIPDPPTAGAREAVAQLRAMGFQVVVHSARTSEAPRALDAREAWLTEHDIHVDAVVREKLPSDLYVDDKGFRFEGDWPAVISFVAAGLEPWNR